MANTRAVEEVSIPGKTRRKTSVFWSTVPENEQFRNVKVPGVALESFKEEKKDSQAQKYAQVVQKSKSDSAVLKTLNDPLTVTKRVKLGHKAVKQREFLEENKEGSNIFKGATSKDQLPNVSCLSESTNSRRASLKNLNIEDKKRVANLIKELAKTGEERELALERLQEERVSFEERLSAVQEEQRLLKEEKESLKHRLEKSEKLLKKYESELKDVKTEKEKHDRILKKKSEAQPQSTQTSPMIQTLSKDDTSKPHRFKSISDIEVRETNQTLRPRDVRLPSSISQVPVYTNRLFDVKVSNLEHSEQTSEESQGSAVIESGGLHELYMREYSLQLRLQEQQIEIQRQQVQLQQQLQLLQQQQQQRELSQQHQQQQRGLDQYQEQQEGPAQHYQEQRPHPLLGQGQHHHPRGQQELSNKTHKQEEQIQEWPKQVNQDVPVRRSTNIDHDTQLLKQPLSEQPYSQQLNWHERQPYPQQDNETISTQHSPTQQTNLLQNRTPERSGLHAEPKHRSDIAHKYSGTLPQQRYGRHTSGVNDARLKNDDRRQEQSQTNEFLYRQRSAGSPSHYHYQQTRPGDTRAQPMEEYYTSRNEGQHDVASAHYHQQQHHMTTKRPQRKHRTSGDKEIDYNNNEYFQARPFIPKEQTNHYDVNRNLAQGHYPHERLSDPDQPYSDTDEQTDKESHCHCGLYPREQHFTTEDDRPTSKHAHSRGISQQAEPHPAQICHQSNRHQRSHNRTTSHHQKVLRDPTHVRLSEKEPRTGNHHNAEYHHQTDTRMVHSSQGHDYCQFVPQSITHKHEQTTEPAFEAAIYQPSQETRIKHQSTGRRDYPQHQSDSLANSQSPPSTQVGITEYDFPPFEEQHRLRPQTNQNKSKDLLDDYIYNHQTVDASYTRQNAFYNPRDKSTEQTTKRVTSRKVRKGRQQGAVDTIKEKEVAHSPTLYAVRQLPQHQDENRNPSYSLYKPTIPQTTEKQSEHPRSYHRPSSNEHARSNYPNSLVEIVENLEINSACEEGTEYSSEEPSYDSDDEESTVLDNIFFLKR